MCNNTPYSKKELAIIKAIYKIDRNAKFSVKGNLENRIDFLYGGIEWETNPISWEEVVEKMYELEVQNEN
jgi:hypothetical protein|tara:strand:- start:598 stop:807 length:210 start_codon:yes stop_codon:yes gene_type:complete